MSKEKQGPAVDPEARNSTEYQTGKQAFLEGKGVDDCPFERGIKRVCWMCGWYDSRTKSRLGHIFWRHGLQWP